MQIHLEPHEHIYIFQVRFFFSQSIVQEVSLYMTQAAKFTTSIHSQPSGYPAGCRQDGQAGGPFPSSRIVKARDRCPLSLSIHHLQKPAA